VRYGRELVFVILLASFSGVAFGWHCFTEGIDFMRREAVRVGAAHYVADDEGRSQFEWKARD
jgi:hypothetical protein